MRSAARIGLYAAFAALRGPVTDGFFQAVTRLGSSYVLVLALLLIMALLAERRAGRRAGGRA
jgi:hypothetical protein